MAARLKMSTFRFTTLAAVIVFGSAVAVYLKRKIDVFSDNCKSKEEEKLTGWWMLALTTVMEWAVAVWKKAHQKDQQDPQLHDFISKEEGSSLTCQSSAIEALGHVIMTQVWSDVGQFCGTLTDACVVTFVILVEACQWGSEALQMTFNKLLDCCVDLSWGWFKQIQAGFNSLWTDLAEIYRQVSLPENSTSRAVVTSTIALTCVVICLFVTVVWYRRYKRRSRNSTDGLGCQTNSYGHGYDYLYNDCTPLRKRYQKESTLRDSSSSEPNHALNMVSTTIRSASSSGLDPPTVWGVDRSRVQSPMLMLMYLLLSLLFVSIPWEFCRLYQVAVSNRAAVASAGAPAECSTESLSLLQTLRLWLSQQLAWSHDNPCDRYYQAMFVDPLWEVTPFMVVVSVVTRCLVHPAELLSAGLGRALRVFFAHIPLHWQPVCLLLVLSLTLLTLLMTCSYRLCVPLLFRVEPRTPVRLLHSGAATATTASTAAVVGVGGDPRGNSGLGVRPSPDFLSRRGSLPDDSHVYSNTHATRGTSHHPATATTTTTYPQPSVTAKASSSPFSPLPTTRLPTVGPSRVGLLRGRRCCCGGDQTSEASAEPARTGGRSRSSRRGKGRGGR